jgi:hypothetical protein
MPRTLPIRVEPREGEAIDSWLETLAHRSHTSWLDLAEVLGGIAAPGVRLTRLPTDKAAVVSEATGVAQETVLASTLTRYYEVVVAPKLMLGRSTLYPWGAAMRSRFCPVCLARSGGRWQLSWRLGCVYACVEHNVLLADVCPDCGRSQRQGPTAGLTVPTPGRCAARRTEPAAERSSPARCGADLSAAPLHRLATDHPAITAQRLVLEIIRAGTASFGVYRHRPLATREALVDVHALATRVLADTHIEDLAEHAPADLMAAHGTVSARRWAGATVKDVGGRPAAETALAVTVALGILDAPDIDAAGERMRWLIHSARRRNMQVDTNTIADWSLASTRTLTAVQLKALAPLMVRGVDHLRYRTTAPLPGHPVRDGLDPQRLVSRVPSLLWPEVALRLAPPDGGFMQVQASLSAALLLVGSKLELDEAVEMLGSVVRGTAITRTLAGLRGIGGWTAVATALTALAEYLQTAAPPIDYQRRRALDYRDLLPKADWHAICRRAHILPGSGNRGDFPRALLFERLSGLPTDRSPFPKMPAEKRARLAEYPRHLTPALTAELDHAAREFLDRHGIDDEPLDWQPPKRLRTGLALPGSDPDLVDIRSLHQLIACRAGTLPQIAAQLDTSADTARMLLHRHPAPNRHPHPPAGRPGRRPRGTERLTENTLTELYFVQERSIDNIGSLVGMSANTVRRVADEYGIALTRQRRRVACIERHWLYREYVTHGRTLADIGKQVGFSASTLSRHAKRLGIPTRDARGSDEANHLPSR